MTENRGADLPALNARPRQRRLGDMRRQINRRDAGQAATKAANGGARAGEDDNIGHEKSLSDGFGPDCPRLRDHASVTLRPDDAAGLMDEVRSRTRSQTAELKSKTILQPRHQAIAKWLLSHPSIEGSASVHLTHKKYFVVSKLFHSTAEELAHELGEDIYETGVALAGANLLFFLAPQSYGT